MDKEEKEKFTALINTIRKKTSQEEFLKLMSELLHLSPEKFLELLKG